MCESAWPIFSYEEATCRKRCRDIQDILSDDGAPSAKYSRIVDLLDDHEIADWTAWGQKVEDLVKAAARVSAPRQERNPAGGRVSSEQLVPLEPAAGQVFDRFGNPFTSSSFAAVAPAAVFNVARLSDNAAVIEQNRQKALAIRAEKQAKLLEAKVKEETLGT